MSQADVDVMRSFVERFLAGDLPGVLDLIHPDMVLNEGASLPWGGDHVGKEGFARLAGVILTDYDLKVESYDLSDAGDFVVARMRAGFTHRRTGRHISMPVVELYELRDGLIWRADIFYKDTHAITEAQAEAAV